MRGRSSTLAVAVAAGVLSWVYLVDGELKDWETWRARVADHGKARSKLRELIAAYEPDTVVTEDPDRSCAKAGQSLKLLRVVAQDARDQAAHHVRVVRSASDATKLEKAQNLARRFPPVAPLLPAERKLSRREERRMIVFDALALAVASEPAGKAEA